MDARTIETAASLATTLIIAITAFAALRQIRHNRMANELQIHLNFVNDEKTKEIRDAVHWTHEFARRIKDPAFARHLVHDDACEERDRLFDLIRFFERYASLVIVSGLSERLIFYEYAGMIRMVWDNIYEAIPMFRASRLNPHIACAFEHLAMRAKRFETEEWPREFARLERDPRIS